MSFEKCQNISTLYPQNAIKSRTRSNYQQFIIAVLLTMSNFQSAHHHHQSEEPVDRDINDIFDDIALSEERINAEGYQKGLEDGKSIGNTDGYHLGYHRGAELGAELGFYYGVLRAHFDNQQNTERQQKSIELVLKLITDFPRTNDEQADILGLADTIRAQYRKTCALLKINGKYPESDQLSF